LVDLPPYDAWPAEETTNNLPGPFACGRGPTISSLRHVGRLLIYWSSAARVSHYFCEIATRDSIDSLEEISKWQILKEK
jgi:hypothetical protein